MLPRGHGKSRAVRATVSDARQALSSFAGAASQTPAPATGRHVARSCAGRTADRRWWIHRYPPSDFRAREPGDARHADGVSGPRAEMNEPPGSRVGQASGNAEQH